MRTMTADVSHCSWGSSLIWQLPWQSNCAGEAGAVQEPQVNFYLAWCHPNNPSHPDQSVCFPVTNTTLLVSPWLLIGQPWSVFSAEIFPGTACWLSSAQLLSLGRGGSGYDGAEQQQQSSRCCQLKGKQSCYGTNYDNIFWGKRLKSFYCRQLCGRGISRKHTSYHFKGLSTNHIESW